MFQLSLFSLVFVHCTSYLVYDTGREKVARQERQKRNEILQEERRVNRERRDAAKAKAKAERARARDAERDARRKEAERAQEILRKRKRAEVEKRRHEKELMREQEKERKRLEKVQREEDERLERLRRDRLLEDLWIDITDSTPLPPPTPFVWVTDNSYQKWLKKNDVDAMTPDVCCVAWRVWINGWLCR